MSRDLTWWPPRSRLVVNTAETAIDAATADVAAPPAPVNSATSEPAPVQLLIGPLGNLDRIYRSGFE